jgi:hypothetical protein
MPKIEIRSGKLVAGTSARSICARNLDWSAAGCCWLKSVLTSRQSLA